ncbi:MAG: dnaA1 [Parachlamydiales bacterium]|nr:dnaA1 [Parachlamydiales bacterium]
MVFDEKNERRSVNCEKMKAWDDLLSKLEQKLGPEVVAQWLRPMKVVRFDAANIFLEATPFQQSWFEEQIRPLMPLNFCNNNQRPIKIHFEKTRIISKQQTAELTFIINPDPLEKEYSLDQFLPSSANLIAYETANEIARAGKCGFNPVFFSGPSGSGKTHLLMGIALSLQALGKKVFYVSAQTFTDHVVQAIRLGHMQDFRNAYRAIDALIVDDIHLLARRSATQEEFFHTFNSLHTLDLPIILSANDTPGQLPDIEQRLISRFEWGISLSLHPPDPAALKQILNQKSKFLDLSPSTELIDFLLLRFTSKSHASIEALHALAHRCPKNLQIPHVERVLKDLLEKESESVLTIDKVIKQTAVHFGIRTEDLTGKSQMREFAQPRQIAMFLCRTLLEMPFQGIGRLFNRDHSTVMSSVKQVKNAIETNQAPFAEPVEAIVRKLVRRAPLPALRINRN